jgi:hypothetical protein
MPDIKAWLETAGEPVAETCFPPGEAKVLPYICFLDSVERTGGDMKNLLTRHSLTVERYSRTADDNAALEALFDAGAIPYTKDRQWLSDEECYLTTYDLQRDLIEREEI